MTSQINPKSNVHVNRHTPTQFQNLSYVKTSGDQVSKKPPYEMYACQVTGKCNASTMSDFPNETSSSSSVQQPDTDSVLADPLPCPRAICTIPRDNTAAARVRSSNL